MTTYAAALADGRVRLRAACIETAALDSRLLLKAATGASDADLIARGDDVVSCDRLARYRNLLDRRLRREPLAQIVGEKEFYGLAFKVSGDVLSPRPESELLVEKAVGLLSRMPGGGHVCDIGTGSGALLVAILRNVDTATGVGVDVSPAALCLARTNAGRLGVGARADFIRGDFMTGAFDDALGSGGGRPAYDVIVSNPPYISTAEIERLDPEVARYEPRLALDGGRDGLDAYRSLVPQLRRLLKAEGAVVLEIGAGQCEAVSAILAENGFRRVAVGADLGGTARCLTAGFDAG